MTKITINVSDEHDKKLKHIIAEKNISSKAGYIEKIIAEHIDNVQLE